MGKLLLAVLLGTVVLFAWGAVMWTSIPLVPMRGLQGGEAVVAELEKLELSEAVYYWPPMEAVDMKSKTATPGPTVLFLAYSPYGHVPGDPKIFVYGILINFVACLIVGWMLMMSAPSLPTYARRTMFVFLCGVLIAVFARFMDYNWLFLPNEYVAHRLLETVVGWLLVGLVMAGLIKAESPRRTSAAA